MTKVTVNKNRTSCASFEESHNFSGGSFYQTVQNLGIDLPQRDKLNVSNGLTASDNGGGWTDIKLGGTLTSDLNIDGSKFVAFGGTTPFKSFYISTSFANNDASLLFLPDNAGSLGLTYTDNDVNSQASFSMSGTSVNFHHQNATSDNTNVILRPVSVTLNSSDGSGNISSFVLTSTQGTFTGLQRFTQTTTTAPIHIIGFSSDPSSSAEGQISYNTTSHLLKFYNGTSWISISGGSFLTVNNPAYTGILTTGTLGYSDTGILFSAQSSANSYNQAILQNTSNGTAASTNFNVSNDQGTASTNFGEFGINSSGFTGSGAFNTAGYVYLAAATTDLAIGTYSAKPIHFVVNSGATDAMTISSNQNFTFNQLSVSSSWSSALKFNLGNPTAYTSATEFIDFDFGTSGRTATWIDGTVSSQRFAYFRGTTVNKTTTSVVATNAYTLFIDAPILGAGVSGTTWALGLNGAGLNVTLGINGQTGFLMKRFTDSGPSGNFIDFQSVASTSLFKVAINGDVTAASFTGGSFASTNSNASFSCFGGNGTTNAFIFQPTGNFITASSTKNLINLFNDAGKGFAFPSGTNRGTALKIIPSINNSGGTNVIIGIDYNPTETSLTGTAHYFITNQSTTAMSGFGIAAPTSMVHISASTTTRSSLCVAHGVAPTSPVDGDFWTTTAGAFIRINGVTKTFTLT